MKAVVPCLAMFGILCAACVTGAGDQEPRDVHPLQQDVSEPTQKCAVGDQQAPTAAMKRKSAQVDTVLQGCDLKSRDKIAYASSFLLS